MTLRLLPTGAELSRLYTRTEARAVLGWSNDTLRRRLATCQEVTPSGCGRGMQFTGAQVMALFFGGTSCGLKSTLPAHDAAGTTGWSVAAISSVDHLRAKSHPRSRTRRLQLAMENTFSNSPTATPSARRS